MLNLESLETRGGPVAEPHEVVWALTVFEMTAQPACRAGEALAGGATPDDGDVGAHADRFPGGTGIVPPSDGHCQAMIASARLVPSLTPSM